MGVVAICASTWQTSTGPCTITRQETAESTGVKLKEERELPLSTSLSLVGLRSCIFCIFLKTQYNENDILKPLKIILFVISGDLSLLIS